MQMNTVMADDGSFYFSIQGIAEGTSYNIIYQDHENRNFQLQVEDLLAQFEKSLSVYDETSIISRINRNERVAIDDFFRFVFNKAKAISHITEGAFDMSAEPLFRLWGFSSQKREMPDEARLTELMQYIGMDKVRLEGEYIAKTNPNVILNANAIAKGYSADIVSNLLEEQGCCNFLVEIGGEIRVRGVNTSGEPWRIGIDRPSDNNLIPGQDLQVILQLTDRGIATSGNYRQFYMKDGRKIAHTIDPVSGYPVDHNLLSVTVIASSAITADAFATAFLVAGLDKALEWIELNPELEALFICDEEGEYKVYYTPGVEDYLVSVM